MNQGMKQDLERVSALADGALEGEAFALAVGEVGTRDELRRQWQMVHLVGDVLRSGAHAPCSDSAAFLARLRERMAAEAVVRPPAAAPTGAADIRLVRAEAANEPVFRWKMVAGVASVAAAAAIGWAWMGQGGGMQPPAGAQLARSEQAVPATGQSSVLATAAPAGDLARTRVVIGNGSPQVMLRDPRLDELLEAHQQASGASQMPSGFLRNATFEGPSR